VKKICLHIFILSILANLIYGIVFNYTPISLTIFCTCVHFMCPPDEDLVQVETCRRAVSDKWLFIIGYAICWIEYCMMVNFSLNIHLGLSETWLYVMLFGPRNGFLHVLHFIW
jgi:hypothetical protein